MRPLFMQFPAEEKLIRTHDMYMLGPELLVAPVLQRHKKARPVILPQGHWIHLWSGQPYTGGTVIIEAPLGKPPVFFKADGKFQDLFDSLMGGR
jgi:alpha-glucosidase